MAFFNDGSWQAPYAFLRFRYTDLASMAGNYYFFYTCPNLNNLELTHSQLRGGKIYLGGGPQLNSPPWCGWTNTLFERTSLSVSLSTYYLRMMLRNNLFWRGTIGLSSYWSTNLGASIQNNLFDNVSLSALTTTNSYNGYINTFVLSGSSGNNVSNATFAYDIGPLGRYYQPTNSAFLNAGSTSATNLGLFSFTTTTNQVVEGTSTVDLGLHFAAVDASRHPLDTDADGIPDYLEDLNGNGVLDPSLIETDWQTFTTLTNALPGLQVFTPLK